MPRNGNGIYILPAGNPVVTGTTISSAVQNSTMSDVANALTTSMSSDGQTVPTANLPMGGFKLTGLGPMLSAGDSVRYEDLAAAGQAQTFTYYTTAGTAPAFTLTPAPALQSYAAGQRFNVVFNAAGTLGSNTLAVSGLAAKNLKQYNEQGVKQPAFVPNGLNTDIEYDGTDFVVIDPVPHLLRNRLINGGMWIDQRNNGGAQTFTAGAALAYSVDRWYGYCTGANVTGQRVAGSGASQYRYRFTGAASVTGIGFGQRIEAANSFDLNSTTAMLSVDLANSLLTSVTWGLYYANTTDTFGSLASPTRTQIATGTFTITSTVSRYSTAVTIPAGATTGLELVLLVGAQTSGIWDIGAAQLDPISNVFETRNIGSELALCLAYLPTWNCSANQFLAAGQCASASTGTIILPIGITPRVPPTGLTISSAVFQLSQANGVQTGNGTLVFQYGSKAALGVFVQSPSGLVAGNATLLVCTANATIYATGCEL